MVCGAAGLARVHQDLVQEPLRAMARGKDPIDLFPHRFFGVELEQFRVAYDRHQHVVEVMSDAACKAAKELHLLRPAQGLLSAPLTPTRGKQGSDKDAL